jgi:hypothetical protein
MMNIRDILGTQRAIPSLRSTEACQPTAIRGVDQLSHVGRNRRFRSARNNPAQ